LQPNSACGIGGAMRTLAIETSSEACSIALFGEDRALLAHDHQVIGRGHAEALVPMIAALPAKGHAARILVSLGPGSFTGVRIGLATARALGFAWQAEVLGYPSLALLATMAQADDPQSLVTVCMNGGHGEWFIADFGSDGMPQGEVTSLNQEAAQARSSHPTLAGNRAAEWAALRSEKSPLTSLDLLPDARHVLSLPPALLTRDLAPAYGRGPDAMPLARPAPA
jgi:tRNA threonylcarbamoyladenosine biosynthesis protein TsaB